MSVKLFIANFNDIFKLPEYNGLWSERLENKLAKTSSEACRRDSLAVETLLKHVLKTYGKLPILEDEGGKPKLKNGNIKFSLSHSDGLAACALSEDEVGVDCETLSCKLLKAVPRVLDEKELQWSNGELSKTAFLWTSKEAFSKYTGKGFKSLSDIRVQNARLLLDGRAAAYVTDGRIRLQAKCFFLCDKAVTVVSGDAEKTELSIIS